MPLKGWPVGGDDVSLDADALADRRRLKRRLFFWRSGAILVAAAALFVLASREGTAPHRDQIARIDVSGIIVDDRDMQKLLEDLGETSRVKAVILSIDSPGGTTTGAEAFYEATRKLAGKKPVVAVLGTVAASGGYIAAISADHIVARGNTLTGSIGVLFQWTQFSGLMEKVGVEMREIKSAPLKAEPNPFHAPSPEAIAATKSLIDSSYDWFLDLVKERRGFDEATAHKLGDGRVYTGWQAVDNGLVDQLGGEEQALAWLAREKKISKNLPVYDWQPRRPTDGFAGLTGRFMGSALSSAFESVTGKTLEAKRLTLDGLVSLWHADRY